MSSAATTAPQGRRERKREEKRRQILARALALLNERGIQGLTWNQLARELDYVPAALYRYFPSWDALLAALQLQVIDEAGEELRAELARLHGAPGWSRLGARKRSLIELWAIAGWMLHHAEARPEHSGLIGMMLGEPRALVSDDVAASAVAAAFDFVGPIAACFERAAETGALKRGDAFTRTFLFLSSIQALLQSRKLARFIPALPDLAELVDQEVAALLGGWGAPAALPAQAKAWLAAQAGPRTR